MPKKDTADEVKGAPKKTDAAKKKEAQKGKESWRHKLVSGSKHPDHKPPVTVIAEASDEAKEKYEDSINAEREKQFSSGADWRDLEGEKPQDESDAPEPRFPKGAKDAANP